MLESNKVLLYLSGQPIPIRSCNIVITNPRLKDVAVFGEEEFFLCVQLLTRFQPIAEEIRQGNNELGFMSDFQLLLETINANEDTKVLISSFLAFIAPEYRVQITPTELNFFVSDPNPAEGETPKEYLVGRITPFTFDDFAETISDLFLPQSNKQEAYNPANDLADAIAKKLQAGKEKIAQMKSSKGDEGSLFGTFASVVAVGLSIDINVIMNYTPFQLFDAVNRYWSKEENNLYQRISTTPFMNASEIDAPEEWNRNLYK